MSVRPAGGVGRPDSSGTVSVGVAVERSWGQCGRAEVRLVERAVRTVRARMLRGMMSEVVIEVVMEGVKDLY